MVRSHLKSILRKLIVWGKTQLGVYPKGSHYGIKPPVFNNLRVDAKQFKAEHTVEELCQTAEDYFRRIECWDMVLAKPFNTFADCIPLLMKFAHLLNGLKLYPDMTILDFGAGAGWASKYLNQLGLKVISLDVSQTALKKGEELKKRSPVFGSQPEHTFLHFDGRRIDLPKESIDRILCIDAFHHVPNKLEVLKEMYRVLRHGGIAGFAEPGPNQSKEPGAQLEMDHYKVLEDDIVIEDIFKKAMKVGFSDQKLICWTMPTEPIALRHWHRFLYDPLVFGGYVNAVCNSSLNFPIFFLYKGEEQIEELIKDSRDPEGLMATIEGISSISVKPSTAFEIELDITNISDGVWLPSGIKGGSVNIGGHLSSDNKDDKLKAKKELRFFLSSGEVRPGEKIHCKLQMPGLVRGKYTLEVDLVSEYVIWFQTNGSEALFINIVVE